jgi:hypothetical protein
MTIGDRVRVTFGTHCGRCGVVEWISGLRGPDGLLYGVRFAGGVLMGFAGGWLRRC